jgi:hypothetical protein
MPIKGNFHEEESVLSRSTSDDTYFDPALTNRVPVVQFSRVAVAHHFVLAFGGARDSQGLEARQLVQLEIADGTSRVLGDHSLRQLFLVREQFAVR